MDTMICPHCGYDNIRHLNVIDSNCDEIGDEIIHEYIHACRNCDGYFKEITVYKRVSYRIVKGM